MVFHEKSEIGNTLGDLKEGIFEPANHSGEGASVFLADNSFKFPQPFLVRILKIDSDLGDQILMRDMACLVSTERKTRLPT